MLNLVVLKIQQGLAKKLNKKFKFAKSVGTLYLLVCKNCHTNSSPVALGLDTRDFVGISYLLVGNDLHR